LAFNHVVAGMLLRHTLYHHDW